MRFVVLVWFLSRIVVCALLLANGTAAFGNWDGAWYGSVAHHGYEYAPDGKQHNVAFFPLFPLVVAPLVHAGIPWPLAAALVANLAFLAALTVLFRLARTAYDEMTARWCVALAALLPMSLFCSVAYPQSLYLLASALALALFSSGRFRSGGLAGACATATSGLGIPLAAAMLTDALVRRRLSIVACALVAFAGVAAFAAYCAARFGDPLAFVHAQAAWRHGAGFDRPAWQAALQSLITFDGFRQNASVLLVPLGLLAVLVESRRLGALMTLYACFALAVLIFSGTPFSVDRNAYAIAPLLVAIGAIVRRVPVLGYAVLALSALLLVIDAGRFAHFQWVA